MRLWQRAVLICFAVLAVFALAPVVLAPLGVPYGGAMVLAGTLAFFGGNGALYFALQCPHCGRWACHTPRGLTSVWPGLRCRYCDRPY